MSKNVNGGYYIRGVRISLGSVVSAFNRGESPETIQRDFPLLNLSQIYGAIAFYLDHRWAKIQRAKAESAKTKPCESHS